MSIEGVLDALDGGFSALNLLLQVVEPARELKVFELAFHKGGFDFGESFVVVCLLFSVAVKTIFAESFCSSANF